MFLGSAARVDRGIQRPGDGQRNAGVFRLFGVDGARVNVGKNKLKIRMETMDQVIFFCRSRSTNANVPA